MTLDQVVETWKKVWPSIVARAWLEDDFLERLRNDTNAVLADHQIPALRGVRAQLVSDDTLTKATMLVPPGWHPGAGGSAGPHQHQVDWNRDDLVRLMDIQVQETDGATVPLLLLPMPRKPEAISLPRPFPGRPKHCCQTSSC